MVPVLDVTGACRHVEEMGERNKRAGCPDPPLWHHHRVPPRPRGRGRPGCRGVGRGGYPTTRGGITCVLMQTALTIFSC